MATLSPTDLTNLRTTRGAITPYLSVFQPVTLLTAQVNNGSIARGARTIAYDNGTGSGFSTIAAGQPLLVQTSVGVKRVRIKSITGSQSTGTITIAENGHIPWADNQVITVLHDYPIWTIPPCIRGGVFYKDYNTQYGGQNLTPTPIAIAGPDKAGFIQNSISYRAIQTGTDNGIGAASYSSNPAALIVGKIAVDRNIWLRFADVNIPQGATVTAATLSFVANTTSSNSVSLRIYGDDEDNPTVPTNTSDYNGRPRTTAYVDWSTSSTWTAGDVVSSPDITTVIQEIVDRGGFASGNAIQIFVQNNGGTLARYLDSFSSGNPPSISISWTMNPTFTLDATQSYTIAQGATIAAYSWSCVKNGGSTSGITIASATSSTTTLTITSAGAYWLRLVVTDSNGRGQSTYRLVFVYDDDNPPYEDFVITSMSGSWNSGGWSANIQAFGNVTEADFPDYARVLLWYQGYFGDTEYYVNLFPQGDNVLLNGYIRRDTDQDEPGQATGRVDFEITTAESVLDNTTDFGSVSLNSVNNPNTWYRYASWLTVGRAIHHELKWHTTFLDTWDCLGLTTNVLGVPNVDFTESSILQRANSLAWGRGHFAKFVSNRLGQAYLVTDSQMLNDAGRAALDTIFTLGTTDLTSNINVLHQPEDRGANVDLDGFAWNGSSETAYISVCPGYRESSVSYGMPGFRGTSTASIKNQVVSSQTDANEKCGRAYAVMTMPIAEIRVETHGNYIGAFDIIPSVGWYNWGLSDATLLRELDINGTLNLCREVNINVSRLRDGVLQLNVILEPQALGIDGIQGNYPVGYPAIPQPNNPDWENSYDAVYIGTTDAGAFVKEFGQTPDDSNSGLSGTSLNFRSIRLDPLYSDALPESKHLWACTEEGIAYSFNGTQTWTEVNESTFGTPVNDAGDSPAPATGDLDNIDLCFDPQDAYRIYLLRTTITPNQRAWLYVGDITDPASIVWENYQVGIV